MTNCTISGNSVGYNGGGLANYGDNTTLTNCTISGNSSGSTGGGLGVKQGGTITLTDCTVSGNTASTNGGGLYNLGGTIALTNCTVSSNVSLVASAGVPILSTAGSDSGFSVSNSDLLQTNLSSSSVTGNIGDEEGLNSAASIAPLTNGQFGPAGLNDSPGPNPERRDDPQRGADHLQP